MPGERPAEGWYDRSKEGRGPHGRPRDRAEVVRKAGRLR
jgi:hypothetical protein